SRDWSSDVCSSDLASGTALTGLATLWHTWRRAPPKGRAWTESLRHEDIRRLLRPGRVPAPPRGSQPSPVRRQRRHLQDLRCAADLAAPMVLRAGAHPRRPAPPRLGARTRRHPCRPLGGQGTFPRPVRLHRGRGLMSAYNALKHFIRAEAEMFVSEFTDEPIGVVASGAVLSLTWKGRAVVTVSASLPTEGRVGTVTVYQSGAYPHEYLYLRTVRYPHDIRK